MPGMLRQKAQPGQKSSRALTSGQKKASPKTGRDSSVTKEGGNFFPDSLDGTWF